MVKRLTRVNDSDDEDDSNPMNGKDQDDEDYDQDQDMLAMLGFSGFDTTKGKIVDDNVNTAASGAISKHKKRVYRQYMNRKGGFNKPLQKIT